MIKKIIIPLTIAALFYGVETWKWQTNIKNASEKVTNELVKNSEIANALIPADAYADMLSKKTIARSEYNKLLNPLLQFHKTHPEIAHIYTATKIGNDIYTILDTTPKIKALLPNYQYGYQTKTLEKITDPDNGIKQALSGKEALEKDAPLRQSHGADIANYIPIQTQEGETIGVVALTMNKEEIAKTKEEETNSFLWNIGIFTTLFLICGIIIYLKDKEIDKKEAARERTEEQFKTMTEKMPGVVYIFSTRGKGEKGNLLFLSSGSQDLIGITQEEAEEKWKEITDFLPSEQKEEEVKLLRRAKVEGSPWECEFQSPNTKIWVQNRATAKKDESGNTVWFGTLSNVSFQKKEAEKLGETNSILKQISEAPDELQTLSTICEYACNTPNDEGILHICSGKEIYAVAGTNAPDSLISAMRVPRTIGKNEGAAAAVAIQKQRVFIPAIIDSTYYKDAPELQETVRAAGIQSTTLYPLLTKEGTCLGVLEILKRDYIAEDKPNAKEEQASHLAITAIERHQARKTLEENEKRYRTLFEASPVGICETDENGEIAYSNSVFNKAVDEKTLGKLKKENALEGRKELTQGKKTLLAETTSIEKANGKHHLITFISDISEQKQKEESAINSKETAEAANKAKSEFLAVMSHEIRTPLNGVIGFSQILQGMELGNKERTYVNKIRQSGETLLATINDILNLSKIEAGRVDLEYRSFNILETIETTRDILLPKTDEKGIFIEIKSKGLPPAIIGDETRIRQILLNLAGNAVKFTEKGGVTVQAEFSEDKLILKVRDTGIGISEINQKKLFQPFSQADSSTTRKYGGTGLGLVICKKLAEIMGGSIELNSGEGVGSTFTVIIPAKVGEAKETKPKEEDTEKEDLLPLSILVAEDDEVNRMVIGEMLKGCGHEVEFAKNGREAVEKAKSMRNWINIILMDMRMPEMDGIEATKKIREDEKITGDKPLLIFALTANALEEDKERCLNAGMNNYLSKPIDIIILKKALSRCQKAKRKELGTAQAPITTEDKNQVEPTSKEKEEATPQSNKGTYKEIRQTATTKEKKDETFADMIGEWGFGVEETKEDEGEEIVGEVVNEETLKGFIEIINPEKMKYTIFPSLRDNCTRGCATILSKVATAKEKSEAAHKMCGSLGTFGCTPLEKLSRKIEAHYNISDDNFPNNKKFKNLVEKTLTQLERILEKI